MKNKRGKKLQINFSNRWLYTFILLGLLIIVAVGISALTAGTKPNPGHSVSEMGVPSECTSGQVITWNGSDLVCKGASIWRASSGNIEDTSIKSVIIEIGDWDMNSLSQKFINVNGLTVNQILQVFCNVRIDATSDRSVYSPYQNGYYYGGNLYWGANYINGVMAVWITKEGTFYNQPNFNDINYNRGWCFIDYI